MESSTIAQPLVRNGSFSSSSAWKLMTKDRSGKGFGEKAKTYIKQVMYEQRLGRSINKEIIARSTSWGKLVEQRAFDLLGLEYKLVSNERLCHRSIPYWTGMPDLVRKSIVGDVKCPFSLETFCDKIEALKDIETYKKEFPEDYWQHISNACLLESNGINITHFEAIVYCPYLSELNEITLLAQESGKPEYMWISYATENDIPWLKEGGVYKNLNTIRFEVSEEDKNLLTERVLEAGKLLIPSVMVAEFDESVNATIVS